MGSLDEDIQQSAEWISTALQSSGYNANFSGPSLHEIDRFFDEHAPDGEARRGGLLAEDLGSRLFAVGAYVGEVIRRNGGEWTWVVDETSERAEIDVELQNADGATVWPVQRVMKRFANGAEDGLAAYASVLGGVEVGPAPTVPPPQPGKRRWFGRG